MFNFDGESYETLASNPEKSITSYTHRCTSHKCCAVSRLTLYKKTNTLVKMFYGRKDFVTKFTSEKIINNCPDCNGILIIK
jgi:hypothetical protein